MSERRPILERFKSMFLMLARTADVTTRDASPGLRPFLRAAVVGFTSLMFVAMLPLFPVIWLAQDVWLRRREQKLASVSNLENHASRAWVETSPQAAVDAIRNVFDRSRSNREGVEIDPFGRFEWAVCADDLASLLYRYEAQLQHWDKALEIAELMASERSASEPIFPTWVLSKAKCLVRLGRYGEALALLMAHRDAYDPQAPVNLYLEEVRAGRG